MLDLVFDVTLKFSTWQHYKHLVYFAGKFKVLGLGYISVADPGEGPGGPTPLVFRPNEAQRAEKFFFGGQGPPLSEGLDTPLHLTKGTLQSHMQYTRFAN